MSELKTKPTKKSQKKYLKALDNKMQADAVILLELFEEITKEKAVMWGESIVGFGTYHYVYKTGREGDWMKTGFSVRKHNSSLYIMSGAKKYPELLEKLGPHKAAVGCLYIKRLSDINIPTLKMLIKKSWTVMNKTDTYC